MGVGNHTQQHWVKVHSGLTGDKVSDAFGISGTELPMLKSERRFNKHLHID